MKKNILSQKMIIKNNLKKPEFWIGLVTILVAITLTGILTARLVNKAVINTAKNQKIISPVPTTTGKVILTPTPSIQLIKKLADTGYMQETVQEGDNYWVISERVCGTGVYYMNIKALNETLNPNDYDGLQKGEVIMVECK